MSVSQIKFNVDTGPRRVRLEEYLFDRFPNLSRMYIRDVIRSEKCEINGRVENKGKRVRSGDFVEIELEIDRETAMRAEAIPLEIVYEDDELIAINKRGGMLVHPTHRQKNGTLLNALSFYLNLNVENGTVRPGLVHRLDRDTSGLLVVAKNLRSHRILSQQFQKKTVTKIYLALVEGVPVKNDGTIEAPIGRFADKKRWGVKAGGSPAITHYQVIKTDRETTLLELRPITGRTNQLRIHCESIGHPIIGDVTRGGRAFGHLCLHASTLQFRHPFSGRHITLTTEPPDWFKI